MYYHMGETFEQIAMTPTTSRSRDYPSGAAPADSAAGTERPRRRSGALTLCSAPSMDWSDTEYGISDTQIRQASVDRTPCKRSDTLADMFGCGFSRKREQQQLAQQYDRFAHSSRVPSVQANAWCIDEDSNDMSWCPLRQFDDEIVEPRATGWIVPGLPQNLDQRSKHLRGERREAAPWELCAGVETMDSDLAEEYVNEHGHQGCMSW